MLCPFGLTKMLDFILRFLAMAMTEQAHHCSSGLTKTFTCVQLSNTYLSATLTIATFPTAVACRGFDASACTPTPRDLLSSHWQLQLHFIWKGSQPFIYRCAPRGTRSGACPLDPTEYEILADDESTWNIDHIRLSLEDVRIDGKRAFDNRALFEVWIDGAKVVRL